MGRGQMEKREGERKAKGGVEVRSEGGSGKGK